MFHLKFFLIILSSVNRTGKWFTYFSYLNWLMSGFILSLTGVNRAMALFRYQTAMEWFSWKRTPIMIFAMWSFAAIVLIFPMVGKWGFIAECPSIYNYTIQRPNGMNPLSLFILLAFGSSVLALVVVNVYIQYEVKKQVGKIQIYLNNINITEENRKHNERVVQLETNFSRTVFIMMLCFCLCHMPSK